MATITKRTPTGRWGKDREYSASVNSASHRIENGKALPEISSVTLTLAADHEENRLLLTLTRQELSEAWEWLQKCEENEKQKLIHELARKQRNTK